MPLLDRDAPIGLGAKDGGGRLSVLRNRNFTLLWVGSVISNSGSWMQMVARGWLVYKLTGSAFALAVVVSRRLDPIARFPPLGSFSVDRGPLLRRLEVAQPRSLALALGA